MKLKDIKSGHIDTSKIPSMEKKLDTIFQYNADLYKTSYINWRTGFAHTLQRQFTIIGEAYFSSAYNLLQQCLIDNSDRKADSWIFPIMFNVIHGIEVYLKAINSTLSILLNTCRGISEGGHDLKSLCGTSRNLIIKFKESDNNDTTLQMFEAIKVVENFISNIYEKTNDMTFARYPLAKDKHGHFYIETLENEVVDLELFNEQILYVYRLLDFIYEESDLALTMQNEYIYT